MDKSVYKSVDKCHGGRSQWQQKPIVFVVAGGLVYSLISARSDF